MTREADIIRERIFQAQIIPIFPTPIMTILYPDDLKKEYEFIKNIPYRENVGSHSKDTYLFKSKELITLKKFIEKSLATYMERALSSKESLTITQAWTNKNPPGTSHKPHTHANSLVSGVFYFDATGKDAPPIQFQKTHAPSLDIHPHTWTPLNSGTLVLPMKAGSLVLFPSSLKHAVPTHRGNSIRYSLSFNTFCLGDLGTEEDLNHLNVSQLIKDK